MAPHLGRSIRRVLFEAGDAIHRTELAQPAIFALEYAVARVLAAVGVTPAWLARASRVDTPTMGFPDEAASPLTVLIPIRSPVKEPGPIVTPNPSMVSISNRLTSQTVSIMVIKCLEWVWLFADVNSAHTTPLSMIATLQLLVAVSRARIFMLGSF